MSTMSNAPTPNPRRSKIDVIKAAAPKGPQPAPKPAAPAPSAPYRYSDWAAI